MSIIKSGTRRGRRPSRSRGQWEEEVARWRRSGLKSAEYAAKNSLSQSALLWWSCQLRKGTASEGQTSRASKLFLPMRVAGPAEAKPAMPTPHVEVLLLNGRRVRVVGDVDLVRRGRLMDAAEGRGEC